MVIPSIDPGENTYATNNFDVFLKAEMSFKIPFSVNVGSSFTHLLMKYTKN